MKQYIRLPWFKIDGLWHCVETVIDGRKVIAWLDGKEIVEEPREGASK